MKEEDFNEEEATKMLVRVFEILNKNRTHTKRKELANIGKRILSNLIKEIEDLDRTIISELN